MPGSLPCFDHTLRDNGCPACDDDGGQCNICGCAGQKAQPAPAPLCGGDEVNGCAYHCNDPECAQNKPAPAPLPEEVAANVRAVRNALRNGLYPRKCTIRVLLSALDAQARCLAEAEDTARWEMNKRKCAEARLAEVEAENGKLILSLMDEQERTEHLSLRNLDAAARAESADARVRELEAELAASKQNERRWIAKGEEAIAERNAANAALEAIKKHQEIVAGTGAAQMSTTWKIADAHLRSIGSLRASLAATEVPYA